MTICNTSLEEYFLKILFLQEWKLDSHQVHQDLEDQQALTLLQITHQEEDSKWEVSQVVLLKQLITIDMEWEVIQETVAGVDQGEVLKDR